MSGNFIHPLQVPCSFQVKTGTWDSLKLDTDPVSGISGAVSGMKKEAGGLAPFWKGLVSKWNKLRNLWGYGQLGLFLGLLFALPESLEGNVLMTQHGGKIPWKGGLPSAQDLKKMMGTPT